MRLTCAPKSDLETNFLSSKNMWSAESRRKVSRSTSRIIVTGLVTYVFVTYVGALRIIVVMEVSGNASAAGNGDVSVCTETGVVSVVASSCLFSSNTASTSQKPSGTLMKLSGPHHRPLAAAWTLAKSDVPFGTAA